MAKAPITRKLADDAAEQVKRSEQRRFRELESELAVVRAGVNNRRPAGPWECIERKELTANTASVEFTNLSGDTDVEYRLRGWVIPQASATSGLIELLPNGDTTNYRTTRLSGDGTTASTAISTSPLRVGRVLANGELATFEGSLYAKTGSIRAWSGRSGAHDTGVPDVRAEVWAGYYGNTTSAITSLKLVLSNGENFASGSRFELYRRTPWPA